MKPRHPSARQNALTHGIFASLLLAGAGFGEETDDLLELISTVKKSIRPADGLETILVEKLSALLLRQTRIYKADLRIAPKLFARVKGGLDRAQSPPALHLVDRENQVLIDRREPSFDLMLRYETTTERQIGRTLEQIQQLRQLRDNDVKAAPKNGEVAHAKSVAP